MRFLGFALGCSGVCVRVMEVRIGPFCENAMPGWLSVMVDLLLLSLGQWFCLFLRKRRFGFMICLFACVRFLYLE